MLFDTRVQFELADFAFRDAQLSAGKVNTLMDLWAAAALENGGQPPFADKDQLHAAIDAIPLGSAPWKACTVKYTGPLPLHGDVPSWMTDEHELFYRDPVEVIRNQLQNPAFDGHIDYAPYKEFGSDGERRWSNLMSADWAWKQAVVSLSLLPLNACSLIFFRTSLRRILEVMAPHLSHLLREAIRQQFL